jgi:hypothetical protein
MERFFSQKERSWVLRCHKQRTIHILLILLQKLSFWNIKRRHSTLLNNSCSLIFSHKFWFYFYRRRCQIMYHSYCHKINHTYVSLYTHTDTYDFVKTSVSHSFKNCPKTMWFGYTSAQNSECKIMLLCIKNHVSYPKNSNRNGERTSPQWLSVMHCFVFNLPGKIAMPAVPY